MCMRFIIGGTTRRMEWMGAMGVMIAQVESSLHSGQPFSARIAGIEIMPEFDVFFVLLPAEEDFPLTAHGREID